jgi:hypothetical protein
MACSPNEDKTATEYLCVNQPADFDVEELHAVCLAVISTLTSKQGAQQIAIRNNFHPN